jgi:RND family efflux transporter MFP subunit
MSDLPTPSSQPPPVPRGARRAGAVLAIVVVLAVAWGVAARIQARAELRAEVDARAVPTVTVAVPTRGAASDDLVLPGTVVAWSAAPIYARTSGYLKRWLVDIGTPVKAGQLLAEIDAPEIDQQLLQAQADLATADANAALAQSTAERWKSLLEMQAVSKQDTDEKLSDAVAKKAALASAKANMQRLQQLQDFERIVAPFDGIITARNTDVGALINAGSVSGAELFRIEATHKLRVYVQVPQAYAASMKPETGAELRIAEHPDRHFAAQVERTADTIDPASRTLQVQLAVENADNVLLPGAYAEIHFKQSMPAGSLRLPANTLLFRPEGLSVATVGSDSHVAIKQVELGRDFGREVEVVGGLGADDRVIVNPPDSIGNGDPVRIAPPAVPTAK